MKEYPLSHVIDDLGALMAGGGPGGIAIYPLGAAPAGAIKNVVVMVEAGITAGTSVVRTEIVHPGSAEEPEAILFIEDMVLDAYSKSVIMRGVKGVQGYMRALYLRVRMLSGPTTNIGRTVVTLYIAEEDPDVVKGD